MRTYRMILATLTALLALVTGTMAIVLSVPVQAQQHTPDSQGTIKVGPEERSRPGPNNEPQIEVCILVVQGFSMDASSGTLKVTSWPPNSDAGTVVINDTWSGTPAVNGKGFDFTKTYNPFPDPHPTGERRHFKVEVTQEGRSGVKDKVFWITCPAPPSTPTRVQ